MSPGIITVLGACETFSGLRANPNAPKILAVSPETSYYNGYDVMLTLTGQQFYQGAAISVNGVRHAVLGGATASSLEVILTNADQKGTTALDVTVTNPDPPGGSGDFKIPRAYGRPLVLSASPSGVAGGSGAFVDTLTGYMFTPATKVSVNGQSRTVTFVDVKDSARDEVLVPITAQDAGSLGTLRPQVSNPTPGGGIDSSMSISVSAPVVAPGFAIDFAACQSGVVLEISSNGSAPATATYTSMPCTSDMAWSPDGTKFAYVTGTADSTRLNIVQSGASTATTLVSVPVAYSTGWAGVSWAPDGSRLAFGAGRSPVNVYVVNADGTALTKITSAPGGIYAGGAAEPEWSPDGKWIAYYQSFEFGQCQFYPAIMPCKGQNVFVMAPDGSNVTPVTRDSVNDYYYPHWSPDSKKLVYESDPEYRQVDRYNGPNSYQPLSGSRPGIFTAVPFVTGQTQLLNAAAATPTWSPDGLHIAFVATISGGSGIYLMAPDGSGLVRLTDSSVIPNIRPLWRPKAASP